MNISEEVNRSVELAKNIRTSTKVDSQQSLCHLQNISDKEIIRGLIRKDLTLKWNKAISAMDNK